MHSFMLSCFSHVRLSFTTPWTVTFQAPLSMGFSRQEYWSGLPCPPPDDLPNPGINLPNPGLPHLPSEYWSGLLFPLPGDLLDPGINPCLLCLLRWQADFYQ